jgi:Family of unknown function (DUF5724)/Domain of unknown function (DUF4132)
MLTAEEATARLATLHYPAWQEPAARRAAALPRPLREPAEALLSAGPSSTNPDEIAAHGNWRLAAAATLDELSAVERSQLLSALHPGLGPAIARWWTDGQERPYQRGWSRKGFRILGSPQATRPARLDELTQLLTLTGPYDADPVWLAIWGGYRLGPRHYSMFGQKVIGDLLASAIDLGGQAADETLATLLESGNGEHPTGMMGRHVIVALLGAARPEGWEFTERLLLAAQRQEGLRQSILESLDEAHPAAFDRMLAVILDNRLLRFAAAVRAACVWLGFDADVTEVPLVEQRVRALAAYRADRAQRSAALAAGDPWDVYVALCAGGMRDVTATIGEAGVLATAPTADLRAVAVRYAAATCLTSGQELVRAAVDDQDIRVAALAAALLNHSALRRPGTFDALARLANRLPVADQEEPAIGVEQRPVIISRTVTAGRLVQAVGDGAAGDLLPWLPVMDANGRASVARLLAGPARPVPQGPVFSGITVAGRETVARLAASLSAEFRPVVIGLLTDRSSHVRGIAIEALTKTRLDPAEAPAIEALLTRAASDLRRGALTLLASLPLAAAQASAARLAASKDKRQRDAGAELLRLLGPVPSDTGRSRAGTPGTGVPGTGGHGQADLRATYLAGRTEPTVPRPLKRGPRPDQRSALLLREIDELAARHRDVPVTLANWQGKQEMLFGDVRHFPLPFGPSPRNGLSVDADDAGSASRMVLGEVFRTWWAERPDALRGLDDARDALRAHALAATIPARGGGSGFAGSSIAASLAGLVSGPNAGQTDWWQDLMRQFTGNPPSGFAHSAAVRHVTSWLVAEHANGPAIDESLDALEATLASVPRRVLTAVAERSPRLIQPAGHIPPADWRNRLPAHPWHALLTGLLRTRSELFTTAQIERWYRLMRWVERPAPQAEPLPVTDQLLAVAHAAGLASDADAVLTFLHPCNAAFHDLTRHWRGKQEARYPGLVPIADRVRDQVVAIEAERGDLPTAASAAAMNVSSVPGVKAVARLLAALGKTPLTRGGSWHRRYSGAGSRSDVLSHLIRVSFPAPGEAGADLGAAAAEAGVPTARLVDLALYAPQWADSVEEAVGWPGLADGVLWLHAHTKDRHWSVAAELRDSWAAQTAERTPLSAGDLVDGAVDVDWFHRAHAVLGAERLAVLRKAARHASAGTGHRRAQLYADAMLGHLTLDELRSRIAGKRDQDAVRALGLLPLPGTGSGQTGRDEAVQLRYAILREFELGSKVFGAQRQASERTAVRIGVANLTRTAGYPDPLRFTWAVEARQAADLADGPVCAARGDVAVTLSVTAEGTPELTIARAGRPLKSVPAALRKDPDIAALQTRKADLAKQATRVRASLEAAMVAQEAFTQADLADLRRHPVVAPMLAALVWVTEDGITRLLGNAFGALPDAGTVPAGITEPAGTTGGSRRAPAGPLRIAHPVHFVADGTWVAWQERLFKSARRQPFKQVFRELYVPTQEELKCGPVSQRYDGHQVQPRQAFALFGRRGWVASQETGDAARAFHAYGLVARVMTDTGFLTAAEADLPVIDGVCFTRRGDYLAQPLDTVPKVAFSEAMRDLDLVVSVAHAGGVDPEATASTTEMRAALVRETARLLKLGNVGFAGQHAVITGRLGEYSVHLGSGTVHRRPGGAVCIIPVGSQHRGRLFLPFADDDPKTAEIVAKVLLLARDHEIKDPTILEQL